MTRDEHILSETVACPNCTSTNSEWFVHAINGSTVVDGRLQMHDIRVMAFLGCLDCSETIRSINEDEINAVLNVGIESN